MHRFAAWTATLIVCSGGKRSLLRSAEPHLSWLPVADRRNHRRGLRRISSRYCSGAQARHQLRVGDLVEALGLRVADPRMETADIYADIYKVSKLKLTGR